MEQNLESKTLSLLTRQKNTLGTGRTFLWDNYREQFLANNPGYAVRNVPQIGRNMDVGYHVGYQLPSKVELHLHGPDQDHITHTLKI